MILGELLTERICAGLVGGILGTPFAFYFGKKRKGVAMKRLIMPLMIALLFVASVSAQEFKVPVEVVQRGRDSVGLEAAYALRENIRKSHGMALVADTRPCIKVLLLSLDSDQQDEANYISAIGTVIVFDSLSEPVFLTFGVNLVGAEKGALYADSLISHIEEQIERLRRDWPELYIQLRLKERVL